MHQTDSKAEEHNTKTEEALYYHSKRRDWGLALLAWDREDKRGYHFEDGKLRVFKKGYFGLLERVDAPLEDTERVAAALRRRLGWREQARMVAPKRSAENVPFEYQLKLFKKIYPKGFNGSKWAKEKRGIDTTRRLQRHRNMSLVEARKHLCRSNLNKHIQNEDFATIIETMLEIGNTTNLVTKSKLRALEQLSEEGTRDIGERVFELLHGEGQFAIRFERFIDALERATGGRPSWQLATVLISLFFPREHVCVKATTLRRQAACIGRRLTISAMPNAPMYERLRTITLDIFQRLRDAGYTPRDILDVYDFMETTLSPKAMKRIEAMKASDSAHADKGPDDERAAA